MSTLNTVFDPQTLADDLCEVRRIYAEFFAKFDKAAWDKPVKGGPKEWNLHETVAHLVALNGAGLESVKHTLRGESYTFMGLDSRDKFNAYNRKGIDDHLDIPMKELCANLLDILDQAARIARDLRPDQTKLTAQMAIYNRPLSIVEALGIIIFHVGLVHSAQLHAAWCRDVYFLDYFVQHGYTAHAVNLRGHGNSERRENLRWTRIADYVDDVANAVRQLPSPPILIGHSMGGFIIQKYLEDQTAPAAVLLSSPSPAGLLPTALRNARRHPSIFAKVNLTFSLFPLVATPQLAREAFFSDDLADEQLLEYWQQMQDDSYMAFLDMVALDLPKPEKVKIPMLVLGVARDNMLEPGEIRATARAYNTQPAIIPDVAHNSMLDPRWQTVADRILVWLKEQKL